jgi:hypothetical protein
MKERSQGDTTKPRKKELSAELGLQLVKEGKTLRPMVERLPEPLSPIIKQAKGIQIYPSI